MIGFRVQSPDAEGRIDPPVERILRELPQGDYVTIVPVTRLDCFRFAGGIKGPWVLWDHSEFGWDWDQRTGYVWGETRLNHPWFQTDEWRKFDQFVHDHPPIATFQRELRASEVTANRFPCEYLNFMPRVTPDTREQFNARPIDVCFQWGRSSESRVRLHANIFRQSSYLGYQVVSEVEHIEHEIREGKRNLWATIHTPHYARRSMPEVQRMFAQSKIVVSMAGCGQKTFRGGEIPNSIIAFPKDELAMGVFYQNGANCIRLSTGLGPDSITHERENVEVHELAAALKREGLYEMYLGAVEVADHLRPERYLREYVIPKVEKAL